MTHETDACGAAYLSAGRGVDETCFRAGFDAAVMAAVDSLAKFTTGGWAGTPEARSQIQEAVLSLSGTAPR